MSLPEISGVARLVDDPELRYGPSGTAVCKVRLVFSNRRKNERSGKWEDGDTFWINATAFKEMAENVAESLQRGTEVVVTGRVKTRNYETREGEKRSVQELLLDGIGPNLRWNSAKVNKAERSSGRADSGGWETAGASAGGGTAKAAASSSSWDDEPPF